MLRLDSSTKSNNSHKPPGMTANLSLKCGDSELCHPSLIMAKELQAPRGTQSPWGYFYDLSRKGWFPRAADFRGEISVLSQLLNLLQPRLRHFPGWAGCWSQWNSHCRNSTLQSPLSLLPLVSCSLFLLDPGLVPPSLERIPVIPV